MEVIVQHLQTELYLASADDWVTPPEQARRFPDVLRAIAFCIQRSMRQVRLVAHAGAPETKRYFYPFGQDPEIKAERKKLRRNIAEHRRLKKQKQSLLARMDLLRAEAKEKKKQFPFARKSLGQE